MNGSGVAAPRVHIFSGGDTVGKEAARTRTIKAISEASPSVFIERFDRTIESFSDYIARILTPDMFGNPRVFTILHAENLNDGELELLDKLLDGFPEDAYLILDIGETEKRKGGAARTGPVQKLHAARRSKENPGFFVHMEFQKPPEYKVTQWLLENARGLCGRTLDKDAAQRLVDLAGNDIAAIHSELQKIDIHLDEGEPVDREIVDRIVGASRQMTVFDLVEACGSRRAGRVLNALESLFSTTCSVPMIIGMLYRHYGGLFRIRQYARRQPQDMKLLLRAGGAFQARNEAAFRIGRAAGLLNEGDERKVYPVVIAPGIVPQAQQYTDEELKTILKWLAEFDVGVKTGQLSGSRAEVESLCYKLLRVKELCTAEPDR